MNYSEIADELSTQLQLGRPPVAVAFVDAAPEGVQTFDGAVPSACSFWPKAEVDVFYAPADRHFSCAIGAMTMGFELPQNVQENLAGVVERMCGCGYISSEEPVAIPTVRRAAEGIVYGPLKEFPLRADVVLMWMTPRQAMIYSEAIGNAAWTSQSQATLGRPTCAALPLAVNDSHPTMSYGCLGMRTFTEVPDDLLLAAAPGATMDRLLDALRATTGANEQMGSYYEAQKAQFA